VVALLLELQREILCRGAYPEIRINLDEMRYNLLKYGKEKHLMHFPPGLAREIEVATKVVSIESEVNSYTLKRIARERLSLWEHTAEPYYRALDFMPTVVTIFPNAHYANKAGLSLEEYETMFYNAVSVDMDKLCQQYHPVEQMMSTGHRFEIKSSNTSLSFELGNRHFTMNALLTNLPDGEIFCAPVENSVSGYIQFEHPAHYQGKIFKNIFLEFRHGEVVDFGCDTEKNELSILLTSDSGARKMGEFGIGINPAISELTNDILFDEKVAGTLHIAMGDSHPEVGGTNHSVIHFDIVKDMRQDGEVSMDGRVIYKNGCFV
jgi:aminopeptidase